GGGGGGGSLTGVYARSFFSLIFTTVFTALPTTMTSAAMITLVMIAVVNAPLLCLPSFRMPKWANCMSCGFGLSLRSGFAIGVLGPLTNANNKTGKTRMKLPERYQNQRNANSGSENAPHASILSLNTGTSGTGAPKSKTSGEEVTGCLWD